MKITQNTLPVAMEVWVEMFCNLEKTLNGLCGLSFFILIHPIWRTNNL